MRKCVIAVVAAVLVMFGCTCTAWADDATSLHVGIAPALSSRTPSDGSPENGGQAFGVAKQARPKASARSGKSARSVKSSRSGKPAPAKKGPKGPKRTVADGVYFIGAFGKLSCVLAVAGESIEVGANVALATRGSAASQRWCVEYDGRGYYTIANASSGLKLGVAPASKSRKANVVQCARGPKSSMKWEIRRVKAGRYTLVNKRSGQAVCVAGEKNVAGANARCGSVIGGEASAGKARIGKARAARARAARAQQFTFEKSHLLFSGLYSLYSKLSPKRGVIELDGGSLANGARARLAKVSGEIGQRFKVAYRGRGLYSIQAASGRYLADAGGAVVQAARPRSGLLSKRQLWRAQLRGGGIVFENRATGRCITVAGGAAAPGAKMSTVKFKGARSQTFRPVREARLLEGGMFSLRSRASSMRLDVTNASWDAGANVTTWHAHDGLAQKFVVVPTGAYCRIAMALSGTVLQVESTPASIANAYMGAKRSRDAAQLWRARITDSGIEFVNMKTGGVLSVRGSGRNAGENVVSARSRGLAIQAWQLVPTSITHVKSLVDLKNIIAHAPSAGDRGIGVGGRGTGYALSGAARDRLVSALEEAWSQDGDISAVMVDLSTGVSVSVGPDRANYGASTFKAAYVTYLFQDLLERGVDLGGDAESLMEQAIGSSSNDAYHSLRARFGEDGFRSWLDEIGLGYLAGDYYPWLTARSFALIWAKIYAYVQSGGDYVDDWHALFDHSYRSYIREALGSSNAVFSKPGWYPQDEDFGALDDGAIVRDARGRAYLLAVLSNVNCESEQWMLEDFVRAIDAVHREIA